MSKFKTRVIFKDEKYIPQIRKCLFWESIRINYFTEHLGLNFNEFEHFTSDSEIENYFVSVKQCDSEEEANTVIKHFINFINKRNAKF